MYDLSREEQNPLRTLLRASHKAINNPLHRRENKSREHPGRETPYRRASDNSRSRASTLKAKIHNKKGRGYNPYHPQKRPWRVKHLFTHKDILTHNIYTHTEKRKPGGLHNPK